jgi:dihydrofolate reductase
VDTIELAVIPVLLGGGIPLFPPPAKPAKLTLTGHKIYQTGIVKLEYSIEHGAAEPGSAQARRSRRGKRKR